MPTRLRDREIAEELYKAINFTRSLEALLKVVNRDKDTLAKSADARAEHAERIAALEARLAKVEKEVADFNAHRPFCFEEAEGMNAAHVFPPHPTVQ